MKATLLNKSAWMDIETAPKDGTEIELMNAETGQYDKGYWYDYTKRGGSMTGIDGEWDTVFGNGDMTHWKHTYRVGQGACAPLPP